MNLDVAVVEPMDHVMLSDDPYQLLFICMRDFDLADGYELIHHGVSVFHGKKQCRCKLCKCESASDPWSE